MITRIVFHGSANDLLSPACVPCQVATRTQLTTLTNILLRSWREDIVSTDQPMPLTSCTLLFKFARLLVLFKHTYELPSSLLFCCNFSQKKYPQINATL